MQRVLFHSTIFGPIHSRRLGTSLGVNLTPNNGKICTFDCLYCEAGYNAQGPGTTGMSTRQEVAHDLEEKLKSMKENGENLDVITFSGNGEPTIHPHFADIIADTKALRDRYFPAAKVSVLTNATQLHRQDVVEALRSVDNNILKMDSAIQETVNALDRPTSPAFTVDKLIPQLHGFGSQAIIQTMFTRGTHDGRAIDNTTPAEVDALIQAYKTIQPGQIMIYSIDRQTPEHSLQKVSADELRAIADHITAETGIPVTTA